MLSTDVKEAYDNFYAENDSAWRMMGAKAKAQNILDVCKGLEPESVLEVGAGDGSILHYLDEENFGTRLYALEIAQTGVEHIRSRTLANLVEVLPFDGYVIPYKDNQFDLVVLSHVLEHVEHERILIRELKRVAKHIVIEVPKDYRFGVDKRMKHFLAYGHINMYTPTLLRFLLQSEGMRVVSDKVSMTDPDVVRYNEFINRKRPRSFFKSLKIGVEYSTKKLLGSILGRKKQEQFANAYTVLVTHDDQRLSIF